MQFNDMRSIVLLLAIIMLEACNSNRATTLDDEIAINGPRYTVEHEGYNDERKRFEKALSWYRKGIGTKIIQAYKMDDKWIVFMSGFEKEGSKW